jgi:hypothetical protein
MSSELHTQPTFLSVAPRIAVGSLEQTLAFYGQLGFALTDQWGEGFAIIERDGIALHLHPSSEPPTHPSDPKGCWIEVNNIEALSQINLPTNASAFPLVAQPWGFTEWSIHDPFGNLIILAERSAEQDQHVLAATPTSRHSIAPRFPVGNLSQALVFYGRLGFAVTYQDEGFAIIERDGISLHFTVSDGHAVCWIGVTNIEALYQQYVPTSTLQSRLTSQPWGMKEFVLCDPFRNLLLFGESIPEEEASAKPAG